MKIIYVLHLLNLIPISEGKFERENHNDLRRISVQRPSTSILEENVCLRIGSVPSLMYSKDEKMITSSVKNLIVENQSQLQDVNVELIRQMLEKHRKDSKENDILVSLSITGVYQELRSKIHINITHYLQESLKKDHHFVEKLLTLSRDHLYFSNVTFAEVVGVKNPKMYSTLENLETPYDVENLETKYDTLGTQSGAPGLDSEGNRLSQYFTNLKYTLQENRKVTIMASCISIAVGFLLIVTALLVFR